MVRPADEQPELDALIERAVARALEARLSPKKVAAESAARSDFPHHEDALQLRLVWDRKFAGSRGQGAELARKHGVNPSFVGNLLAGRKAISTTWKLRFAEFLETPVEDIWPGTDPLADFVEMLPDHVADLLRAALCADPECVKAAKLLLEATATLRGD